MHYEMTWRLWDEVAEDFPLSVCKLSARSISVSMQRLSPAQHLVGDD
jgi:hypothetical protein